MHPSPRRPAPARPIQIVTVSAKTVAAMNEGAERIAQFVEANPDDHSVGYSGLPNLLGEVELDASIMDGGGLRAGSIGALHGYQDAIALARTIMDTMPHVLIVGAGADRLAHGEEVRAGGGVDLEAVLDRGHPAGDGGTPLGRGGK